MTRFRPFCQRVNPWALRDMAERLLEASHRKLWSDADASLLKGIRALLLEAERAVECGGGPNS
jgi:Cobalamin biosynthesis protein CobN and related Mg-chelatases